jgi:hypothetical protein
VRIPGVIERRSAFHAECEDASNRSDASYELETVLAARDCPSGGHEVGELGSPVRSEKPSNQDVCLRPIELLACHVIADRRNLEAPALAVGQDRGEDAWAIETRHAEPIN